MGIPDYSAYIKGRHIEHGLVWQVPVMFPTGGYQHGVNGSVAYYPGAGEVMGRVAYRFRVLPVGRLSPSCETSTIYACGGSYGSDDRAGVFTFVEGGVAFTKAHLGPRAAVHVRWGIIKPAVGLFATVAYEYPVNDETIEWGAAEIQAGFEMGF